MISQLKGKSCQDTIQIRHLESDNENLKREARNLQEAIERVKVEIGDMKKENELLKDKAFSLEKQNIYLRDALEGKEDKYNQAIKELDRAKGLINAQRELSKGAENRHRREIQDEEEEQETRVGHVSPLNDTSMYTTSSRQTNSLS